MTKVNHLVEKILKNWPAKIICLIIAIFLYIFHQASLIDKRSFVLPLSVIQEGAVMPVEDYTKNVNVIIRANTDKITSIHMGHITADINLNNITKPGEYTVPVTVNISNEIMGFDPFEIKVKPETVKIKVEKKATKFVSVEPALVGEPAKGFFVSAVNVTPNYVQIDGPEPMLEDISSLMTNMIDISNASKNLSFEVFAVDRNKMIQLENNGPYKVDISIEPIIMKKKFDNLSLQPMGLSQEIEIISELPKISITLQGTESLLEDFNLNAYSAQIDVSSLTESGKYDVPIKIIYPSYFKLIESSMNIVKIEVEKKSNIDNSDSDYLNDDFHENLTKELNNEVANDGISNILNEKNVD
ncbi:MAG: CdaR family protein [Treponema sp.]|nr:CdaR family protein [Treponema sp.]